MPLVLALSEKAKCKDKTLTDYKTIYRLLEKTLDLSPLLELLMPHPLACTPIQLIEIGNVTKSW